MINALEPFFDRLEAKAQFFGHLGVLESRRRLVVINTLVTLLSAMNALVIGGLLLGFGEPDAGWVAIATGLVYAALVPYYFATGNTRRTAAWILGVSFVNNVVVHVLLGGFANSGATLGWGILVCTYAVMTQSVRFTATLTSMYAVAAVALAFLEQELRSGGAPDPFVPALLAADVFVASLVLLIPTLSQLLRLLSDERRRSERLLLNVLPVEIAARLKTGSGTIADQHTDCTVLFADIAGFTAFARGMDPNDLVEQLNEVFTAFDELAAAHGVEKIKTIGDGYMAVAGAPTPRPDHAVAVCELGVQMLDVMESRRTEKGAPLFIRIGINTGPLVAGVIGTSKFSYDLWGDTVNVASRMESHGEIGRIQVTQSVVDAVDGSYRFEPNGVKDIKGQGPTHTYLLQPRTGSPDGSGAASVDNRPMGPGQ